MGHRHQVLSILRKFKYPLTVLVFLLIITFVGDGSLTERYAHKKEITSLKQEINKYQKKFDEDKNTLNRLKNDPEAIKEVARGKYYMKTEDEDIFVIKDE